MNNKYVKGSANLSMSTARSLANGFYLLFVTQSLGVPILLVLLYDKLAGGILNGFWGVYKQGVIDGDVLLIWVNPIIMLVAYGLLMFQLKKFTEIKVKNKTEAFFIFFLAMIATTIALLTVFWKVFTT